MSSTKYVKPNKEQFRDYLIVQKSGITNMYDVRFVCELSPHLLTKDMCLYIMEHYEELTEEYQISTNDITDEEIAEVKYCPLINW